MAEEQSRVRTWKGKPIPLLYIGWIDQLMANNTLPLIEAGSADRYIDVTLTAGINGAYAKPPQVLFK